MIMYIKGLERTRLNTNEKLRIIGRLKRQCWRCWGNVVLNIRFSRNVNLVFSFMLFKAAFIYLCF